MPTFEELIARKRSSINSLTTSINAHARELEQYRELPGDADAAGAERIAQIRNDKAAAEQQLAEEQVRLDALVREQEDDERIQRAAEERITVTSRAESTTDLNTGGWINTDTGERAAVRPDEALRSHPTFAAFDRRGDDAIVGHYGTLGQMIRSLTTTSGSAIVPTVWAADFIDRVRNKAAVIQAGASVIPMAAKTVNIGRLTGDPSLAFRAESGQIVSSDPTFDNVTLTAKSLDGFVKVSREWMQDAENGDELVEAALADSLALKIDQVALYGGITSGAGSINLPTPPNPRGVLATLNAVLAGNVLGGATNGTTLTSTAVWNEVIDTIYAVLDGNEEPNAAIWSTKLDRKFAKAYDTTGQPIRMPQAVEQLQRFVSNQIPSYTQGTMTNTATDVFVADWDKLLIGERLSLEIEINTQLYAETGEVGIFIHWRGDIAPARPAAFAVYRALGGA